MPINRLEQIKDQVGSTCLVSPHCVDLSGVTCISDVPTEERSFGCYENDLAYLIFTSGSTGVPKGVPIRRQQLDHFIDWICHLDAFCYDHPLRVLNQASFSFDLSVADFYYAFSSGHTLCALTSSIQKDYPSLMNMVFHLKPDIAVMTPTFAKLLLLDADFVKKIFQHFLVFIFVEKY